jgi:hypothetical protein
MREPAPIPASIVKALCLVQSSIGAVAKTQFNKQGNYKFASADDIYAAVARKFGEVGLMIYPLEMSPPEIKRVEKTDKQTGSVVVSQWGQFCFGYMLATEDATWFDPRSSRTIYIQILGPQTFNAAESYCQKQYLRALLKLPTGDMDLDSLPQSEDEDGALRMMRRNPKSSSAAKKDGTDARFNAIIAEVRSASSREVLQHIREIYADEWSEMPHKWHELLEHEYEDKMMGFGTAMAAE